MARLARADRSLLAAVEHRTAEQQAALAVIRAREALVKSWSLLVNTARGLAKGFGLRLPATITLTFGARALARLPEHLHPALSGLLEQIDALGLKIHGYDQRIAEVAERHPEVERLAGVYGVGMLTATTFVLTLGRKERFAHSRDVGVFWGCARDRNNPARAIRSWVSAKSGDKYLRKLLVQCAHHVLGHWGKDSALRQWGLRASLWESPKRADVIPSVAEESALLFSQLQTKLLPDHPRLDWQPRSARPFSPATS